MAFPNTLSIWADLRDVDLGGVDLHETNLNMTELNRSNLSKANLYRANLDSADLSEANLRGANLSEANPIWADLRGANLRGANLRGADLRGTNLSKAYLDGTDLNHAWMEGTILNDLDLRDIKGLETVEHLGPSDIGIQTIYKSNGKIPEVFLRGAGVPDSFIEYMRSLVGKPIDYYSCFISYSSKDQAFADRLYADLQTKGVRCWFAPHDLKIGDKFRDRIDESIRLHDKLLVILSKHSVESDWVEQEVRRAMEKERQQPKHTVLFPIRLDEAVMTARQAWATDIRLMWHMGDFTTWKDHDQYQQAFARLLRDLQAPDAPPPAV